MTELLVETEGSLRILTLNRPEKLNALDGALMTALAEAFRAAGEDAAVRAVLLTGAGRGFCAGADLGQDMRGPDRVDLGTLIDRFYNPLVRAMTAVPKPVLAAVNGVAAGAGMSLALAADIVVAARSASFTQAFVRIGLVPDAGSSWFLPRLVGEGRARALAMLGESLGAERAEAMGLVWRVFEDDGFAGAARDMALGLAARPTRALAEMKRLFAASSTSTLEDQLALERAAQSRMGWTSDFEEGVDAFAQKRPATFTGA